MFSGVKNCLVQCASTEIFGDEQVPEAHHIPDTPLVRAERSLDDMLGAFEFLIHHLDVSILPTTRLPTTFHQTSLPKQNKQKKTNLRYPQLIHQYIFLMLPIHQRRLNHIILQLPIRLILRRRPPHIIQHRHSLPTPPQKLDKLQLPRDRSQPPRDCQVAVYVYLVYGVSGVVEVHRATREFTLFVRPRGAREFVEWDAEVCVLGARPG